MEEQHSHEAVVEQLRCLVDLGFMWMSVDPSTGESVWGFTERGEEEIAIDDSRVAGGDDGVVKEDEEAALG